jgi:hypothetical protein
MKKDHEDDSSDSEYPMEKVHKDNSSNSEHQVEKILLYTWEKDGETVMERKYKDLVETGMKRKYEDRGDRRGVH